MKAIGFYTLALWAIAFSAQAQKEIEYMTPPTIRGDYYSISLEDIIAEKDICKLKIVVENTTSDQYLTFDFSKVGFDYPGMGTYYPSRERELVIAPKERRSQVVKISGNNYMRPEFTMKLEGMQAGRIPANPAGVFDLPVNMGQGANLSQEGFDIVISEVSQSKKQDKLTGKMRITFRAQGNQLGVFDATRPTIVDANSGTTLDATLAPRKKIELKSGEEQKFNINVVGPHTGFQLLWNGAFQVVDLAPVSIGSVQIKQTGGSTFTQAQFDGCLLRLTRTDSRQNANFRVYDAEATVPGGSALKFKIEYVYNPDNYNHMVMIDGEMAIGQEDANATAEQMILRELVRKGKLPQSCASNYKIETKE